MSDREICLHGMPLERACDKCDLEIKVTAKKNEELDELYMVIGSLCFMAEALKKTGTVAHCEKAKQYEAVMRKYDGRFCALISDLSVASQRPAPQAEKGTK
jgi:hypothetical protein